MALFADISKFKEHVGGAVNQTLSLRSIGPWVDMAAESHVIPWIGQATWDALNAESLSEQLEALLPYVQRPVALLTMYEYVQVGNVQLGEGGMFQVEIEGIKRPFKYQETAYRKQMLHHGYESLERLLAFLEANENDYPLWQADPAYARNKAHFINTAFEFRQLYGKLLSRYIFEMIRPIIDEVENFAVLPTLGQAQYDDLKEGISLKALTTDEQALIDLIQRAVVHFSMQEALERHWVQFEGNRVVQLETLEPQGYERAGSAGTTSFSIKWQHHQLMASRHISFIRHYLESRLDVFPLYAAHLETEAEASGGTQTESLEEQYSNDRYFGAFPIDGVKNGKPPVKGIKNI